MSPLHEAAIEMIEVPMPKISGKNSADIRLVVDALDLCYSKEHIDTFVIVSGDSDFSPLVSKLRENAKRVIGIGVRNSSSNLLIGNCDEFIFYDDIFGGAVGHLNQSLGNVPREKRQLFEFLVTTTQRLLQESRGSLYSSLIKDTMKRKKPEFNEANYGYSTFGDLLDDAKRHGLLVVERDARAGGTWVVQGLGAGVAITSESRSKRPRRRGRRKRSARDAQPVANGRAADSAAEAAPKPAADATDAGPGPAAAEGSAAAGLPAAATAKARMAAGAEATTGAKSEETGAAETSAKKKAAAKKKPARKTAAKKTAARKTAAKKKTAKKKATKKKTAPARSAGKKAAAKATDKTEKKAAPKSTAKKTKKTTSRKAAKKTTD
jgi:hypothetical protein